MSRKSKRFISSLFVAAMLFAQYAIASHACPVLLRSAGQAGLVAAVERQPDAGSTVSPETNGSRADAAPCSHMTPSNESGAPNVCAEHCNYGEQSAQNPSLTMPVMAMISLYHVQPRPDSNLPPRHAAAGPESLRAASPPHSILHCCFLV